MSERGVVSFVLATALSPSDTTVVLTTIPSVSFPFGLFVGSEYMTVLSQSADGSLVVQRGVQGNKASHPAGSTVWAGPSRAFVAFKGFVPNYSPYLVISTGEVWELVSNQWILIDKVRDFIKGVPILQRFLIDFKNAAFKVAGLSADIVLMQLPAKAKMLGLNIKHAEVFADAGAMTDVGVTVGDGTGSCNQYSAETSQSIGEATPVSDTAFTDVSQFKSTSAAAHNVVARFTSTGANFGTGSATSLVSGQVEIDVMWVTL